MGDLKTALEHTARGWPVFPCSPTDKRPLTLHGFKDATRDPEQVGAWWHQWPNAMVGVPTGERSGFWCLDLDVDDGVDGVSAVERLGDLPSTLEVSTPRGGRHVLFRCDEERPVRNSASKIAPGIDVRGEGGFVIAAGSVRHDGRDYNWWSPPPFFDLAAAPEWLYAALEAKPEPVQSASRSIAAVLQFPTGRGYAETALERECGAVAAAGSGTRNARLNRAAFSLHQLVAGGELDGELVDAKLFQAAEAAGLVAEDGQAAVQRTIASGRAAGEREPRRRPEPPLQRVQRPPPIDTGVVDLLPLIDPGPWEGERPPPREWAWREWLPARQATYLTGAGSAGKSLFAQQLATCMAIGRPFLGVETRQGVSLYLTCEDDRDELQRRQDAICETLDVSHTELSGKLHLVTLMGALGNELATFDPQNVMATTPAWERLRATVLAIRPSFIALDNVAHLFAGNENIRAHVAAFCNLLNGLAAEAHAAVLFIGHPNKAGQEFSGSTAWENQVRSRLFLDWPKVEGEIVDRDARVLSRAKANYARNGEALSFRWFRWAFVHEDDLLGQEGAALAAITREREEDGRFLACLAKATSDRRAVSHQPGSNWAPRRFAGMPEANGCSEATLSKAMERLFHASIIKADQPLWRGTDRHWKQGLKLVSECGDPPAVTPCGDLR